MSPSETIDCAGPVSRNSRKVAAQLMRGPCAASVPRALVWDTMCHKYCVNNHFKTITYQHNVLVISFIFCHDSLTVFVHISYGAWKYRLQLSEVCSFKKFFKYSSRTYKNFTEVVVLENNLTLLKSVIFGLAPFFVTLPGKPLVLDPENGTL